MSKGRRARRPRAQSPPRAGSQPSGPGPFTPSGRGPRPCLEAGCAVVPAGYCALRCRGRRVLTATPGRRWVPRKRGACGSACGLFSPTGPETLQATARPAEGPYGTRRRSGTFQTTRAPSRGSSGRTGHAVPGAVAGTSSWNPSPLSIFRPPLAICHPFWYRESLVCSNCAPRACVGLGGGAA